MENIRLKAKLRAYSKSPFYNDYVRGVNVNEDGTIEELEAGITYARRDNKWVKIFAGDMLDVSNKLDKLIENEKIQDATLTEYFKNINFSFDKPAQELVYKDYLGNIYRMKIEPLVDNDTIRYNENNQIELKFKPDNETVETEAIPTEDGSWNGQIKVVGIKYSQIVKDETTGEYSYKDTIITGKQIVENAELFDTRLNLIEQKINDIATGAREEATTIAPINLARRYKEDTPEQQEATLQIALTEHACKELNVSSSSAFPNNLTVIDLYKGEKWIFSRLEGSSTGYWANHGKETIVSATNDGVYGVVTGVDWYYDGAYEDRWETLNSYLKGHILSELKDDDTMTPPTFNINGLKERLTDLDTTKVERIDNSTNNLDVAYIQKKLTNGKEQEENAVEFINISDGIVDNRVQHIKETLVQRTADSTIITQDPTEMDEAVNIRFVSNLLSSMYNKSANLENTVYSSDWLSNDGDITTALNYVENVRTGV